MSYIGQQPLNNFVTKQSQEFTPDGSTTGFTLNFAVTSGTDILLMINNVVQEPGAGNAYTASGTTLTMSEAPGASDNMYCIFLGLALQTVNPGDGSVGTSKLVDSAVTTAKLNSSLDLSSKTITLASNMKNTPAFRAYKSGNTTLSDATQTAVVHDSEFFDSDNVYNTSTGVFTVPSGKGGKYFLNTVTRITGGTANDFISAYVQFEINGTNNEYRQRGYATSSGNFNNDSIEMNAIIDLSVGDTVKVMISLDVASGTAVLVGAPAANAVTIFGGYRIIE